MKDLTVDEYVMYQDKLERNGRELISQCSKKIQVHYFLIKDNILVGETIGTFPNGKDAWRSLYETPAGLYVQ